MIKFGTKAQTLEMLKSYIKKANICKSVFFTVNDWGKNKHSIYRDIKTSFSGSKIIVRSSAINEDSITASMAGAYESIVNVDSSREEDVIDAISKVVISYGDNCNDHDEILVQPMINNVSMSGVIFTHDLNTGAPYYVINYDDITGRTDTVTSGITDTSRTLLIHRKHVDRLHSTRFQALFEAVAEIEEISPNPGLDIEFAVTKNEEIYLFQVRPLAVQENWNRDMMHHIDSSLGEIEVFLEDLFRPAFGLYGKTTILGEMPDWNPAELIGTIPRPLSRSIFEQLITDKIWAEARKEMGYKDISRHPLMVNLGGRVFIDVRKSFNSFLPNDLNPDISEKLINCWLEKLTNNPELHDKVEFEIAITVHTLDFDDKISHLNHLLSEPEIKSFKESLLRLTNSIIKNDQSGIWAQVKKIETLNKRRKNLYDEERTKPKCPLLLAKEYLLDCAELGTKPFSILARHAFIAESFLRSLEQREILDSSSIQSFRGSVETVLSEFVDATQAFVENRMSKECFMERFGHLRPGTYDILAKRYDQRDDFNILNIEKIPITKTHDEFSFTGKQLKDIDEILQDEGYDFDSKTLFEFIKEAIKNREYAKFIFSKNISDVLELLTDWGIENGLNREELSFITIQNILDSTKKTFHKPLEDYYREIAKAKKEEYKISQALKLPYLIKETSDIFVIPLLKSRPNFITSKRVQSSLKYLSGQEIQLKDLDGKIILIEGADPGYDWIFLKPFTGLITKYGGANSHMAIRCAELGIPAAIGCGEQIFEQLLVSQNALLDCGSCTIIPS
jgi:glutamine kinase